MEENLRDQLRYYYEGYIKVPVIAKDDRLRNLTTLAVTKAFKCLWSITTIKVTALFSQYHYALTFSNNKLVVVQLFNKQLCAARGVNE